MGDIVGGITNLFGGKTAADRATEAAKEAADQQYSLQQAQLARQKPWYEAGKSALETLSPLMQPGGALYRTTFSPADLQANMDPGYQWRLQHGMEAINSMGAATGNYGSGRLGAALVDYSQGAASDEYQAAYNRYVNSQNTLFNRLSGMAGTGQVATQQMGGTTNAMSDILGQLAGNKMQGAYMGQQGGYNALNFAQSGAGLLAKGLQAAGSGLWDWFSGGTGAEAGYGDTSAYGGYSLYGID